MDRRGTPARRGRTPSRRSVARDLQRRRRPPLHPARVEVVALVVGDDERGEVLDFDPPDRLHAEILVLLHLDLLDAVIGEARRRTADRAEVEAAVLLARVAHLRAAVAL